MRRRCLRVALAALLVHVCLLSGPGAAGDAPPPAPQPGDTVPGGSVVRGQVLRADGTPLTNAVVRVVDATSIAEVLAEGFIAGLSGGLTILDCFSSDPALRICRTERESAGRVDAQGRFAVPAPDGNGRYRVAVIGTVGEAKGHGLINLETVVPPAGIELPVLRLWDAQTRTSTQEGELLAEWRPLPEEYAQAVEYFAVAEPRAAGGVSARLRGRALRASADVRLFEDSPGFVTAYAEGFIGELKVRWIALPESHAAPAGAPPSRGLPCRVQVGGEVVATSPCWLTDGKDGNGPPPSLERFTCRSDSDGYDRCAAPPIASAVLDLGAVQPLDVVVLRGCETCRVSTSTDGVNWVPGPVPARKDPVLDLEGQQARYLRIGVDGPPTGQLLEALGSVIPSKDAFGEPVPVPPPAKPTNDFSPALNAPPVNDLSLLSDVAVWPLSVQREQTPVAVASSPRTTQPSGRAVPAAIILLVCVAALLTWASRPRRARRASSVEAAVPVDGADPWRTPGRGGL